MLITNTGFKFSVNDYVDPLTVGSVGIQGGIERAFPVHPLIK
ncbi:MAG TPA: hypothetical protein VJ697_14980 [Nitrososphaeraceae archaeon]|nr:hypothetical protein [Nitrososphaeraceae archaeon]